MRDKEINLNKSIKIILNYLIGPVLFIWLTYNVVQQIQEQPNLQLDVRRIHDILDVKGCMILLLVIALMIIHWIFEARKWQLLLQPVLGISLIVAIKAIFSGVAFSIATPNRVGEFAGRILHLPVDSRLEGTSFTFIGNLAQMIVTLICGGFAIFFLDEGEMHFFDVHILNEVFYTFKILAPLFVVLSLLIYFKLGIISEKIFSFPIFNKFRKKIETLSNVPTTILGKVLSLSFLRILIFILQYYLLFIFAGVYLDFFQVFVYVSVMFLLLAAVPTITFLELGVRWQIALILFSHVTANKLGVSIAVTAVWLINLIFPAFLGAFTSFSFKGKIFGSYRR